MNFTKLTAYLCMWGAIGSLAFSLFVVAVFRTGLVYTARTQDGTLKRKIPLTGLLLMLSLLCGFIGFQVLANYLSLNDQEFKLSFFDVMRLNYWHYCVLFAFDTIVIDILVIGVWRPSFLRIPAAMNRESMKRHVVRSIPVGLIVGIMLVALSTTVSWGLGALD